MDFDGRNSDERPRGGGKLNRYRQMRTNNQQSNHPNELSSGDEHLPSAVLDPAADSGSAVFGAPIASIGEGQPIFPTALGDAGAISNSSAVDQPILVQQLRQEQQHLHQQQQLQQLHPAGSSTLEQLAHHMALRQQLHQQDQTQQLRQLQLLQNHEDRLEENRCIDPVAGPSGASDPTSSDPNDNSMDALDLTDDDKRRTSPEYRMKRAKNNEAVRKSREKKKMENSVTSRKLAAVVEENNMLEARVERLKKELVVVKGIFMQQTLGFSPSTADVAGAVNAVGDVTGLGVEGLCALGGVDDRSSQGGVALEEVVPPSLPEPSTSSSCNLLQSSTEPPSDLSQRLPHSSDQSQRLHRCSEQSQLPDASTISISESDSNHSERQ